VMRQTLEDARAVLLPAFDGLELDENSRRHLAQGGRAVLIGESRAEYVARRMSGTRIATESAKDFRRLIDEATALAGPILAAIDQEPGGIQRLQGLAPELSSGEELAKATTSAISTASAEIARFARAVGINVFLAPVLDLASGPNPWLEGRRLSSDPQEVARIGSAFIRGVQSEGVAATAKHFPGYHQLLTDPAIDAAARLGDAADILEPGFLPFLAAISAGVEIVMPGPAIVDAFDRDNSASTSEKIVALLRGRFGFKGLILSDDLDSAAVARGAHVPDVAVRAVRAGIDLCMLAAGPQVEETAHTLALAVTDGVLSEFRLTEAAGRVRRLASRLGLSPR
jgi:beta-N-acetylhexosaminidase